MISIDAVYQLATGALGGALVTSFIAPYLLQSKDRRMTRSNVLSAVVDVEINRWAPATYDDLRKSLTNFEAQALVASMNRKLVTRYIYLCKVAWKHSESSFEEFGEGSIPLDLAELVQSAGEHVTEAIWHPRLWQIRQSFALKRLDAETATIKAKANDPSFWKR